MESNHNFFQIRSKNLDVLFKKDYYAQRVHLNSGSSGAGAAAPLNSSSVSPNPQGVTSQQTSSEQEQKDENDQESVENNIEETVSDKNAIKPIEIHKSGAPNVNDTEGTDSSISSKESVIKDANIQNSSPQAYLDTNHAKCQIQMSLNQTEHEERNNIFSTSNHNNEISQPEVIEKAQINDNSSVNSIATPIYPKTQITSSNEPDESGSLKTSSISSAEKEESQGLDKTLSTQNQPGSVDAPTTVSKTENNKRPSLFLYAPSSNTIIPCEEIIIPNHPNVMQEPMNVSLGQKLYLESSNSNEHPAESNSAKNTVDEDDNKENKHYNSSAQNILVEYPSSESETSKMPRMTTVSSCNVGSGNKDAPVTSSTTPGMNENAPAFVPRAQQQYFPTSLNVHQVPQQPHAMIHYDQFGAPYTSFHGSTVPLPTQTTLSTGHVAPPAPGMPNIQHPVFNREFIPNGLQYHTQSSVMSNITVASSNDMIPGTSPTTPNGNLNSSSETSSAESSAAMHSPADLSVYSPANWVPSPSQTPQAPNVGDNQRNILQQVPIPRVEGSEVPSTGSKIIQQQQNEYQKSILPSGYNNQQAQLSSVNGTIPYGLEGQIAYSQRSPYPPHFNSHVYYQPSAAAAANYINNQGGSNVWYNLQQQYYSMNGGQAFVGPQYQGYANGYTSGGTNLQFMCESSTMPSSAGDSMAEDDPRDRSEEEIDIQNQSRTHLQSHLKSQGKFMNNEHKPQLSEKYKLQKQPYPRHPMSNNATVMVSTNPGAGSYSYKKEKETREGSHGKEELNRPFIPGLPAERITNKRVHKKRRKKKNTSVELSGEQNNIVSSSSIILPEGHSTMPAITTQQHQKGKTLNMVHRGSSSSEDLFSESTMSRAENKLAISCTKSLKTERECQYASSNRMVASKFTNSKGTIEGCEEATIDSNTNTELSRDKPMTNTTDSSIAKSFGCDNEKAAYQVCETLTEIPTEGVTPSLPTTSPSSPLQSINPSSSSILISSSCVSSQDEEDIDKTTEDTTNQSGLKTDIRSGGYENRMLTRNRNRDRSSSISSNEGNGNSCKENLSKTTQSVSLNKKIQPSGTDTTFSNDPQKEQVVKKMETKCEVEVDHTKKSIESEAKSKYSDTVKRFNSAATREAALLKVEDNLKQRAGNEEKNQKSENRNDSQFSKHGRNYSYENGSQPKSKNRRGFNGSNVVSSNDRNQKNHNSRNIQASQSPYKLQRSLSSQHSQEVNPADEISRDGKTLYSKVALKATDTNVNSAHSVSNKPQSQNKRILDAKLLAASAKQDTKSSKKLMDEMNNINEREYDAIKERRNSTDDAGWEMATGAYGGSKTKRNRKGARATNSNINNSELSRDSSASNKSMKG